MSERFLFQRRRPLPRSGGVIPNAFKLCGFSYVDWCFSSLQFDDRCFTSGKSCCIVTFSHGFHPLILLGASVLILILTRREKEILMKTKQELIPSWYCNEDSQINDSISSPQKPYPGHQLAMTSLEPQHPRIQGAWCCARRLPDFQSCLSLKWRW